jgi:hypothetical protein
VGHHHVSRGSPAMSWESTAGEGFSGASIPPFGSAAIRAPVPDMPRRNAAAPLASVALSLPRLFPGRFGDPAPWRQRSGPERGSSPRGRRDRAIANAWKAVVRLRAVGEHGAARQAGRAPRRPSSVRSRRRLRSTPRHIVALGDQARAVNHPGPAADGSTLPRAGQRGALGTDREGGETRQYGDIRAKVRVEAARRSV